MKRQVAIVGTGWVGSSVAISTLHSGIADVLLLNDIRGDLAEGEAMDLAQGSSFYPVTTVKAAALDEIGDADVVVIAAGRGGKPGESRLDLLRENARVVGELARRLSACRGVIVVVTNPVDVLTRVVTDLSGLPPARVLGTGTMLDTARLRHVIGRELQIDPHSVHGYVVGEHGDSEVVLWSEAWAGGCAVREWPSWRSDREPQLADEVRRAAYEIIRRKGATNHAIGLVTADLLRCLLRNERRILTVSRVQSSTGLDAVALSLPAIVTAEGAAEVLEPKMNDEERTRLMKSADVLRSAHAQLSA
jgi:L-lactate dehydrogenase